MISELDIAWLAGLLDGEGCIAFMRRTDYRPKHRLEDDVKLAMACEETVMTAYEIIVEIVGEDAVKYPFEERNGCREARAEAEELLSQVILSQAEGSTTSTSEGAETRTVTSATDKRSHECPAPHPQCAEGEDIVRSQSESSGACLNSKHPVH